MKNKLEEVTISAQIASASLLPLGLLIGVLCALFL